MQWSLHRRSDKERPIRELKKRGHKTDRLPSDVFPSHTWWFSSSAKQWSWRQGGRREAASSGWPRWDRLIRGQYKASSACIHWTYRTSCRLPARLLWHCLSAFGEQGIPSCNNLWGKANMWLDICMFMHNIQVDLSFTTYGLFVISSFFAWIHILLK